MEYETLYYVTNFSANWKIYLILHHFYPTSFNSFMAQHQLCVRVYVCLWLLEGARDLHTRIGSVFTQYGSIIEKSFPTHRVYYHQLISIINQVLYVHRHWAFQDDEHPRKEKWNHYLILQGIIDVLYHIYGMTLSSHVPWTPMLELVVTV